MSARGPRRRWIGLAAAVLVIATLTGCDPATPPQYPVTFTPPVGTPQDPPTTIPLDLLDGAHSCTTVTPGSTWAPILLIGSADLAGAAWRASASASGGLLHGAGEVCTLDIERMVAPPLPGNPYVPLPPMMNDAYDATRGAQYVAWAIDEMADGGPVDVVAHERGGLDVRWALRWWPSLHTKVDDVVTLGTINHGSIDNMHIAPGSPDPGAAAVPVFQQSRADAQFMHALNSVDETPASDAIDYTNIASDDDRNSVGQGSYDTRTEAWKLSGATNLLVQTSCNQVVTRPALRDHGWVTAAARDALTQSGPALVSRFGPTAPCAAGNVNDPAPTLVADVQSNSEPPLPDYVGRTPEAITPYGGPLSLPSTAPAASTRTLSEPLAARAQALQCGVGDDRRFSAEPILLVGGGPQSDGEGMFDTMASQNRFIGTPEVDFPVCWVKMPALVNPPGDPLIDPSGAAVDVLRGSQYVVQAIRDMEDMVGRPIDVIAHSRGGLDASWAIKWWPDLPPMVDDVVLLDSPVRGIESSIGECGPTNPPRTTAPFYSELLCLPVGQQSRRDSSVVGALMIDDPTPGTTTHWTTIGTWSGSTVFRQPWDMRINTWRIPGASNIMVQQHCSGSQVTHGDMLTDHWVWAGIADALFQTGAADVGRFVPNQWSRCGDDWQTYPLVQAPPGTPIPPDRDPCPPANGTTPPAPYTRVCPPALPAYVWNDPSIPG